MFVKEDIINLLEDINQKLSSAKRFATISVYGSAAFMIHLDDKRVIHDLDVVVEPLALREIVCDAFVSDSVSTLLKHLKKVEISAWLEFSNSSIKLPSKRQLLAMKIYAAREKDLEDAIIFCNQLGIRTKTEIKDLLYAYIKSDSLKTSNSDKNRPNCVNKFVQELSDRLKGERDPQYMQIFN